MVFVYGAKKVYDRAKKYKKRGTAVKARYVKEKERVSRFRENYFDDRSYRENNDNSLLIVGALGLLYYGGKFVDKQTTKLSDSLTGIGNFNIGLPDFSKLFEQTPHDTSIQLSSYYPGGSVAPGASRDSPGQGVVDYISHSPGQMSQFAKDAYAEKHLTNVASGIRAFRQQRAGSDKISFGGKTYTKTPAPSGTTLYRLEDK